MEAYIEVCGSVDEAVKGASPHAMEMRKSDAADRKKGIKPKSAKEGEEYAKYKMAQMAHSKRERMGEEVEQIDERINPPGPMGGSGAGRNFRRFGNVPGPLGGPGRGPRFDKLMGDSEKGINPPGPMGGSGAGRNFRRLFGNVPGPLGGPGRGPRYEEVEQIDEISANLALTASQKADEMRRKASVAGDKETASKKAAQASRLYAGVGPRRAKERKKERVDEGMDMKTFKANRKKNERRAASDDAKKRGHVDRFTGKPYGTEEAASRRKDIHTPEKKPSRDAARDAARGETGHGGPLRAKKVRKARAMGELGEGVDLFDYLLEYLVAEGYADTNKAALVIMANMSEEWKQSIIEADSVAAMRERAAKRRKQRYGDEKFGRDDFKSNEQKKKEADARMQAYLDSKAAEKG